MQNNDYKILGKTFDKLGINNISCQLINKCLFGLFFLILLFFSNSVFPQNYNFRNFTIENGLPESFVYTIAQDGKGNLWIGTGNGISKFNGFTFENFTTNDSLADNFILSATTINNSLWLGHMNGCISYFIGKKFCKIVIPDSDDSPITHFAYDTDVSVWASSYSNGLYKLNKDKVSKHATFKDQTIVNTFEFLNKTELIVGTLAGLLYCKLNESGTIEIIKRVEEIPESKVTTIMRARDNKGFYIATENEGLFKISFKGGQFKLTRISPENNEKFVGVQDLFEDSNSNLWISTFGNGFLKITIKSSGSMYHISDFNQSNGFISDNVKTIFEDREGIIWVGNYGEGLTQITPKVYSLYTLEEQNRYNNVFSFYINKQFKWIGTEAGLIKTKDETGKLIKQYNKNGLPNDTITSLFSLNGKELWIGTNKKGVFRMDLTDETVKKFDLGSGILENAINSITGKNNKIWIGTKKGLCRYNCTDGKIDWFTLSQGGLPHNYINALYVDSKDRLWISTKSNILTCLKNDHLDKIPIISSGSICALGPITEDKQGRIWVGSNGNGMYIVEDDSIINFNNKIGLLSNYCYSIENDNKNNIWVGHRGGLSIINTSDYTIKPKEHFIDISDNFQINSNAIYKDLFGRIWLGTDKGAIVYDPVLDSSKRLAPVLSITSIKINDEVKDVEDEIVLSPGIYKIRIDYIGISLKEPELVSYQYKLDGHEQWSEVTKNTSVTYNRLPEGEYTFMINTYSGDGIGLKNPLTFKIIIKIPIWKKWWFYILVFIFITIVSVIYVKRREYKFVVENKKLEEKVRQRTSEIECQKNEIEAQRDIINTKNADITSSIQMASHIQNAVFPSLESVHNFLPDSFVLSKPKDIVSGDFYWLAPQKNKIIFSVADCTGHGVPGAFTSLLAISMLNEIVSVQGITESNEIVNELRERVSRLLQQNRENIIGSICIDIALCVLDKSKKVIQYTGGMNDIVYIRDRNLEVVKADRFTISYLLEDASPFTLNEIHYKENDIFYLFSDGFKDQFGGNSNKKYLKRQFYETLLEIHEYPMEKQKELLETKLHEWMGDTEQTDDITVMGLRL